MSDRSGVYEDVRHLPVVQARDTGGLFLMLLLLCLSGNPAVTGQDAIDFLYTGAAVLLAVLLLVRQGRMVTLAFGVMVSVFALIIAVQVVSFSFFPAVTITGFFVRVFLGYAVVMLVRDFARTYVRAMVLLAILSFVFYVPEQLGHVVGFDVGGLFPDMIAKTTYKREIFFYTFLQKMNYRNFGMFWEPGAFGGYLNLAVVFLGLTKDRVTKRAYVYSLGVLTVALLTTMSTAGYVVYPLALLLHCRWRPGNRKEAAVRLLVGMYVVLPIVAIVGAYGYRHLEFLREKIDRQSREVQYAKGEWHRDRLGSLVFDWNYIRKRPLTGWGLHSKTRYALTPWVELSEGMGNGMSDFTAKFGITGMLMFCIALLRGFISLSDRHGVRSVLGAVVVLLMLQGEAFLNYPLFLGLIFLRAPQPSDEMVEYCGSPLAKTGFPTV